MKLLRYAYAILLCIVVVLMVNYDAFNHKWMMFVVVLVGIVLGFVLEDHLKKKFPEIFPKSENDIKAEQLVKDIEEGKLVEDTIKLPRTVFGTLCEIIAVGIIGYALYRAWTLDQRILPVIGLSVISLFMLFTSYITKIKKEEYDPKNMRAYRALVNSGHVTAIIAALLALLLTYFTDPETTYYKWRPLYLCGCLLLAARIPIHHFIYKRSAALMAKVNNYNPADVRVVHTVDGSAIEIVTILMLIGGWCAAALKHQLSGCGILDIPLADLIVCSVCSIGALVLAYFPTWMTGASTFKNDEQVLASIKRCRIAAVILALFALMLPFIITDLDEKTLGYLYVAVLAIIAICHYSFRSDRHESPTNNE